MTYQYRSDGNELIIGRVIVTEKQSIILSQLSIYTKEDGNQIDEIHTKIHPTEWNYLKCQILIQWMEVKETNMNEGDTLPKLIFQTKPEWLVIPKYIISSHDVCITKLNTKFSNLELI